MTGGNCHRSVFLGFGRHDERREARAGGGNKPPAILGQLSSIIVRLAARAGLLPGPGPLRFPYAAKAMGTGSGSSTTVRSGANLNTIVHDVAPESLASANFPSKISWWPGLKVTFGAISG